MHFFLLYLKRPKQNMSGISLNLVSECNFVTKIYFFSPISTFFGQAYEFTWTEK